MSMTRRRLLDDTFKKSVVGNPAIATDSLARMYPGIEMQGWTEQDGTPSPENPVPIVNSGTKNQENGKWEYEVEMAGAQLFDESDIQVVSVSSEGAQRNGFEITGLKPGQYTISTKQKTTSISAYLYAKVKNSSGEYGNVQYVVTNLTTFTVTTSISSGDTLIIYDAITLNSMEVSKSIFAEYGIMLNIGSTALPYQPYHTPQSITLQSDRPLTKWDRLEKRGGQWGWVYKSEEIESYTDESVPGEYFSTTGQLSTGAQVWYETTTETFVPLTTTEQEAMEALHTYRPTTVLSNDAGCEMSLTYKTRKSMEVTT